jgi:hypothetical protein
MVKGNINNENGRNASSKISLFTIYCSGYVKRKNNIIYKTKVVKNESILKKAVVC